MSTNRPQIISLETARLRNKLLFLEVSHQYDNNNQNKIGTKHSKGHLEECSKTCFKSLQFN